MRAVLVMQQEVQLAIVVIIKQLSVRQVASSSRSLKVIYIAGKKKKKKKLFGSNLGLSITQTLKELASDLDQYAWAQFRDEISVI
jgi:hypothetical protein